MGNPQYLGPTTPVNWNDVSQPVPPAFYAPTGPAGTPIPWANVLNYWLASDGNDIGAAMNRAIVAVGSAGGGVVFVPPGVYPVSTGIVCAFDNVQIRGNGRVSQLVVSSTFPQSTPIIWYQAPSVSFRQGAVIRDLLIVANPGPTGCIGIELDGTYYAAIEKVDIEGVMTTSIYLNGGPGGFGAYTRIRGCHLGAVPGGAGSAGTGVLSNNHEFWSVVDCVINWFNQTNGIGIKCTNSDCVIQGNTFDACQTGLMMFFNNLGAILGNAFDRGYVNFLYINGGTYHKVIGNSFGSCSASGAAVRVDNNATHHLIQGNNWKTGTSWTNSLQDATNANQVNYYTANDLGDKPAVQGNGVWRQNVGLNPLGNVAAPAFPATTVAVTNTSGVDVTAYIANGTSAITVIQIAGVGGSYVTTGMQIAASSWGLVRIPAGGSVKFTYAGGTPTWTWMGD